MTDACSPAENAEDMSYMGIPEEARSKFLTAVDLWIKLRQPLMANAAAHKKRDMSEHEARFQLANAALLLAWHMRASPSDAADLAAARTEVKALTTANEAMRAALTDTLRWFETAHPIPTWGAMQQKANLRAALAQSSAGEVE